MSEAGFSPEAGADADLVARLRAGDEATVSRLVNRWSPAMLRVARSFVDSPQSAEDVVQDAWLGMLSGLATFEGRSSLRTWVFTILVNRARSRRAREARTVPRPLLGAQDERAAMMLGIDSDMTALISLALGSGLAGFAAVLLLPLGNIVVEQGYNVLIFAVAVCVIGGLGSWTGTIVASFIIGFAQILTETFASTHFVMVVALLAIIVTLLIKPSGIFGKQKQLEERV